jgi:hypothetical protein
MTITNPYDCLSMNYQILIFLKGMAYRHNMFVTLGSENQRSRFEELIERDVIPNLSWEYNDDGARYFWECMVHDQSIGVGQPKSFMPSHSP